MRAYFRNVNPRRAMGDLWGVIRTQTEHRGIFLLMSAAVTGGIFYVMWGQEVRGLPPPPNVIYFESWREDRTDAEIIAGNIAATEKRRAAEAEEAARQERIRQLYKAVGDATGVDTNKAYAEGEAERAAAKAELDRRNAEILKNSGKQPAPGAE